MAGEGLHTAFLVTLDSCATMDKECKGRASKEPGESCWELLGKGSSPVTEHCSGYQSGLKHQQQASKGFPRLESASAEPIQRVLRGVLFITFVLRCEILTLQGLGDKLAPAGAKLGLKRQGGLEKEAFRGTILALPSLLCTRLVQQCCQLGLG